MNNRENKGENLLRDKMLQHEFAMEEADWEKMDALLSERPRPVPPPITPRSLNGMFSRKWLIGLVLIGLAGGWLAFPRYPLRMGSLSLSGGEGILSGEIKEETAFVESAALTEPSASPATTTFEQPTTNKLLDNQIDNATTPPERNSKKPDQGVASRSIPPRPERHEKSRPERLNKTVWDHQTENPADPGEKVLPDGLLSQNANEDTRLQKSVVNADPEVQVPTDQSLRAYSSIAALPQRNATLTGSARVAPVTVPWTAPHHRRVLQLGLAGGAQVAWVNDKSFNHYVVAPTFGISAKYPLNAHWSIQADAMYRRVNKALNFQESIETGSLSPADAIYVDYTQSLTFYELPIVVKRNLGKGNVQLFAGLRPALVLPSQTHTYAYGNGNFNGNNTHGLYDPIVIQTYLQNQQGSQGTGIRRMDLALTFGGEVRLWRNIWLDIRANQGLLDLSRNAASRTDRTTDAQVGLRYYFLRL